MHFLWKVAIATGTIVLAREAYIALGPRRWRRRQMFMLAQQRATAIGQPLLVVGDPNAGVINRLIGPDYGCGHTCTDLHGCARCEQAIGGDLVTVLQRMPDHSAVIFVSCVLEYVPDAAAAIQELQRVSGGNLYVVTVEPNTLTALLYPGAQRRFFEAPPEQAQFTWKQLWWRGGGPQQSLPALPAQGATMGGLNTGSGFIDTDGETI